MIKGKVDHILILHVSYGGGVPSGEDVTFMKDVAFLRDLQDVRLSVVDIKKPTNSSVTIKFLRTMLTFIFSNVRLLKGCLIDPPRQIIVHNTFPYVSLLLLKTISKFIRVDMYLHNHRFYCVNSTLMRENKICTTCVHRKTNYLGVKFRCKNNNFLISLLYGVYGTIWRNVRFGSINLIAFSNQHEKVILKSGIAPREKLRVIPHYIRDRYSEEHKIQDFSFEKLPSRKIAYFGRLSPEKGIAALLSKNSQGLNHKFDIYGSGPDLKKLHLLKERHELNINIYEPRNNAEIINLMKNFEYIVFPSNCFETFGLVVAEAFSVGTPVLIYNIGSPADYVRNGYNGFIMDPDEPWLSIKHALSIPEEDYNLLRQNARKTYEENFSVKNRTKLTQNIVI